MSELEERKKKPKRVKKFFKPTLADAVHAHADFRLEVERVSEED